MMVPSVPTVNDTTELHIFTDAISQVLTTRGSAHSSAVVGFCMEVFHLYLCKRKQMPMLYEPHQFTLQDMSKMFWSASTEPCQPSLEHETYCSHTSHDISCLSTTPCNDIYSEHMVKEKEEKEEEQQQGTTTMPANENQKEQQETPLVAIRIDSVDLVRFRRCDKKGAILSDWRTNIIDIEKWMFELEDTLETDITVCIETDATEIQTSATTTNALTAALLRKYLLRHYPQHEYKVHVDEMKSNDGDNIRFTAELTYVGLKPTSALFHDIHHALYTTTKNNGGVYNHMDIHTTSDRKLFLKDYVFTVNKWINENCANDWFHMSGYRRITDRVTSFRFERGQYSIGRGASNGANEPIVIIANKLPTKQEVLAQFNDVELQRRRRAERVVKLRRQGKVDASMTDIAYFDNIPKALLDKLSPLGLLHGYKFNRYSNQSDKLVNIMVFKTRGVANV